MEQRVDQLTGVHQAHLSLMDVTLRTLGHTVALLKPEVTTTLRDGPDGGTITEVLGHLRDFDGYFRGRAQLILEQDKPALPAYDHEAIAIAFRYNEQDFRTVYAELVASREQTRALFAALTAEQWARAGVHPAYGHYTLTNAVMQVGIHDALHIEQIAKILAQ